MYRILLPFVLLSILLGCRQEQALKQAQVVVEKVKNELVPDSRKALFDVALSLEKGQMVVRGETSLPQAKDQLINDLSRLELPLVDSVAILPAEALAENIYGVVRLSVCNIRSKPKHSAELATQALMGTQLRILKKKDDWYLVQTPDDYLGWLDKGGFTLKKEESLENWRSHPKVILQTDFALIHSAADKESGVIGEMVFANIALHLGSGGEGGKWLKIELPDGRRGYVPKGAVTDYEDWLASERLSGVKLVELAGRFMGRPYLWGGTSSKGFDCSGFTKTIFLWNGIQLERDASQQVRNGLEVPTDTLTWKNLEPGDLLFFGRKASGDQKEKISHVAIWMGGGRVIHATEMVKVQSLVAGQSDYAADRVKTFVRARRVLGSAGKDGIVDLKESNWY